MPTLVEHQATDAVALVGLRGAGKSTVLRMIAGLEVITGGEIAIDGKVVNRLEPADRDIAMVFQNYALYPHMTVYKNMAYGLKIRRMSKAEIDERVRNAAKILELTEFLDRKPCQLSGGQRQRLAIARMVLTDPAIVMLDEATSALDTVTETRLHDSLKPFLEGRTTIIVAHRLSAVRQAERALVFENGKIVEEGGHKELIEKDGLYASLYA